MLLWLYLGFLLLLSSHHGSSLLVETCWWSHNISNSTADNSWRHTATSLLHSVWTCVGWTSRIVAVGVLLATILLRVRLGIDTHLLSMPLINLTSITARYAGVFIYISKIIILKVIAIHIIVKLGTCILTLLVLLLKPRWHLREQFAWVTLLLTMTWRSLPILLLHKLLLIIVHTD